MSKARIPFSLMERLLVSSMPAVVSATAAGHCSRRSGKIMVARLFIVEDHPAVLSAYKCLLKRDRDLQVVGSAASGEEALTLIPQHSPDLIILDLMLPGINGLKLSQHLYQSLPHLPILIVSSYERTLSTLRQSPAFVPNMKGYLHKQQITQLLLLTIRQILVLP